MKKQMSLACVAVGLVMGFGTSAMSRDPLTRFNVIYDPAEGSLVMESGEYVVDLLHISTTIDFFTGPKPPEYDDVFHVWKPRNIGTRLILGRFDYVSFPPGTVAQGLSPAEVAEAMTVDALVARPLRPFDVWCFSGVSCFFQPSAGDFNNDDLVDHADINALTDGVIGFSPPLPQESRKFDLDFDGALTQADREIWVNSVRKTYFGDANLDGEFNSRDLVLVFQQGDYEDEHARNSHWQDGDWDGDLEFGSADLVLALQSNGYFQGPRTTSSVPEPGGWLAVFALVAGFSSGGVRRRLRGCPPPTN